MFHILDIKKNAHGLHFKEVLDLKEELLERNPDILDLTPVEVEGEIKYEDKLFMLNYQLSYTITLASSRSMQPVVQTENYPVTELFMTAQDLKDLTGDLDDDLILILEGDTLNLSESVSDNILLNIPLKVLTKEEAAGTDFPEGKDWQVMTEERYLASQAEKKEAQSPFAGLAGLFEGEAES